MKAFNIRTPKFKFDIDVSESVSAYATGILSISYQMYILKNSNQTLSGGYHNLNLCVFEH
eukprot:UN14497